MNQKKKNQKLKNLLYFTNLDYEPLNLYTTDESQDLRFHTLDSYRDNLHHNKLPPIIPYKSFLSPSLNNSNNQSSFIKKSMIKHLSDYDNSSIHDSIFDHQLSYSNRKSKEEVKQLNTSINITDPIEEANNLVQYYKGVVTDIPFNHSRDLNYSGHKRNEISIDETEIFKKFKIKEDEKEMQKFRNDTTRRSIANDRSWFFNNSIITHRTNRDDDNSAYFLEYPKVDVDQVFFKSPDESLRTLQINKQICDNVKKLYKQKEHEQSSLKNDTFNHIKLMIKRMPEIKVTKSELYKLKAISKADDSN